MPVNQDADDRMVELFTNNPAAAKLKIREVAAILGTTPRAAWHRLGKLRDEGRIDRPRRKINRDEKTERDRARRIERCRRLILTQPELTTKQLTARCYLSAAKVEEIRAEAAKLGRIGRTIDPALHPKLWAIQQHYAQRVHEHYSFRATINLGY